MQQERLQKVLAHAGIGSRRRAEEIIVAGRVQVDGKTVDTLGVRVDPQRQTITVDGKPIAKEQKVTYILNKPLGAVSTVHDPQGRLTVRQILAEVPERVYPIGRLDADTAGVLLLTNDGDLAYRLTHPSYEVPKVYHAVVQGYVTNETINRLASGVQLEDGPTARAKVRARTRNNKQSTLEMTLHEGRNRQVRRMCAAVGHPVVRLTRIRFAFLSVRGLAPGSYRPLQPQEICRLRSIVNL